MLEDENGYDKKEQHPSGLSKARWQCCSYAMVPSTPEAALNATQTIERLRSFGWWQKAVKCLSWGPRAEC